MRYLKQLSIVALAIAAAGGCTDPPYSIPAPDVGVCTRVTTTNVSDGLAPTFSWLPECAVGVLSVHLAGDTATLWRVSNLDNKLQPPIRYGIVPENGSQDFNALPLETGQAYRYHLGAMHPNPNGETAIVLLWLGEFVR